MEYADIENIFTYHKPGPHQNARYQDIREMAKGFAHAILNNTPSSAEQTLAIRHIQQAVMFANAAIAIHEPSN